MHSNGICMHTHTHTHPHTHTHTHTHAHILWSSVQTSLTELCFATGSAQLWTLHATVASELLTHSQHTQHMFIHRHLRALVGHQEMKGSFSLEGDERIEEEKRWRKRRSVSVVWCRFLQQRQCDSPKEKHNRWEKNIALSSIFSVVLHLAHLDIHWNTCTLEAVVIPADRTWQSRTVGKFYNFIRAN